MTINVHDLEVGVEKIKDLLKEKSNEFYIPEPVSVFSTTYVPALWLESLLY